MYLYTEIVADPGQSALRLDRFLTDRLENASRTFVREKIDEGLVWVNGKVCKASYTVKANDRVQVFQKEEPHKIEVLAENIPLDVIYEDEDILILNKPAGMVVHPGHGHFSGTLINALLYYLRDLPLFQQGDLRPGLAHRIDKDTSGLLVVGKNEAAMSGLGKQFLTHTAHRTYQALVWGQFKEETGSIATNLARDPSDRQRMRVFLDSSIGKPAVTHWRVLRDFTFVSLVVCELETGRMHQIRVHMQYLKHPIFNDARYGGDRVLRGINTSAYHAFVHEAFRACPRQALHAYAIDLVHPITSLPLHFEAPLPDDMVQLIALWTQQLHNLE